MCPYGFSYASFQDFQKCWLKWYHSEKKYQSTPDFVSYTKLPQEGILPLKYIQAGITSDFY